MHPKPSSQLGCFPTRTWQMFSIPKGVIFQELCATSVDIIQLIFFVHALYAFQPPMFYFYNHYNHESDVTLISSTMGTHQSDPLRKAMFILTHFKVLCFTTSCFPSCLFPSIANDTHIINPPSIVSYAYKHFKINLYATCLILPQKCVTWSPSSLQPNFDTPS
jgi:hypothetical protein